MTPAQDHTYFAAFDLTTTKRDDVIEAAAGLDRTPQPRMSRGAARCSRSAATLDAPGTDFGEALGLAPARLTVTFGFGAGLFVKDGKDRYGLAARAAGGAGRSAAVQRRPVGADAHRRRSVGAGLRGRSAGGVSRGAPARAAGLRHRRDPLGADRLSVAVRRRRNAAQSDGLQGRHPQPAAGWIKVVWVGTKGRPGCAAAATWWCAASAWRWSIGTAPMSSFRNRPSAGTKYSGAPLGLKHEFDAARPGPDRQGRQPDHSGKRACAAGRSREQ